MRQRKGLGLGKGSGYYNIIPQYDSYVHSLSAKGVKTKKKRKLSYEEKKMLEGSYRDLDIESKYFSGSDFDAKGDREIYKGLTRKQAIDYLVERGFEKKILQRKSDDALATVYDIVKREKVDYNDMFPSPTAGMRLNAKGKKEWRMTPEDYDTMKKNMEDFKQAKREMVIQGLTVGFVDEMLGDEYGFSQFIELQDQLREKEGQYIDVNDFGKAQIVWSKEKGSIPAYLVVEEDYSVRWYINPEDRSDTIMKQVFVKYKGER